MQKDDIALRLEWLLTRASPPWPYLEVESRSIIADAIGEISQLRERIDPQYEQSRARHSGITNGLFK